MEMTQKEIDNWQESRKFCIQKVSNQQGGTSTSTIPAAEEGNGSEGDNTNEEVPGGTLSDESFNKEVYNRHTTTKQSVETAEASQDVEQGDTQTPSSMNAPTPSASKDTTKSPNSQENQPKTDEKVEEPQKEEELRQLTEADIDADEIADEYSKELAKDFLRGENTGTIAELFYREIAIRAQKKSKKKEEKKHSKQKPSNIPPVGQAAIESGKLVIEGVPESKLKTEAPKTSGNDLVQQALDELKDVMKRFRDAGRMDANVSLIGLNSRQMEMLGEFFRATAKFGYAIIRSGAITFGNHEGQVIDPKD